MSADLFYSKHQIVVFYILIGIKMIKRHKVHLWPVPKIITMCPSDNLLQLKTVSSDQYVNILTTY